MFCKEEKMALDPEMLKKILLKGGDDEEFTMGGIGTISMAPNSHIYFYCDVVPESILKLNNVLVQMAKENLSEMVSKGKDVPDPISIHIQSDGGLCSAGFIGYDVIQEISKKVKTISYVEGYAASAATLLTVGCTERYISPSSTLLVHELSSYMGGKLSEMLQEYSNCKKVEEILESIYLKHTKIQKEDLEKLLKKDVLLTAEECIEKGICDDIRTSIF